MVARGGGWQLFWRDGVVDEREERSWGVGEEEVFMVDWRTE